jgi:hypothetical protein
MQHATRHKLAAVSVLQEFIQFRNSCSKDPSFRQVKITMKRARSRSVNEDEMPSLQSQGQQQQQQDVRRGWSVGKVHWIREVIFLSSYFLLLSYNSCANGFVSPSFLGTSRLGYGAKSGAQSNVRSSGEVGTSLQVASSGVRADLEAESVQPATNSEGCPLASSTPSEDDNNKKSATEIALSFQTADFRPAPFATNEHVQTIAGVLMRGSNYKQPQDKEYFDFSYFPPIRRVQESIHLLDVPPSLVDKDKQQSTNGRTFYDFRERFSTPDGDFYEVDYKYSRRSTRAEHEAGPGLVVIVHGLESSSCSPQIVDAGLAFVEQGFDVACTCTYMDWDRWWPFLSFWFIVWLMY